MSKFTHRRKSSPEREEQVASLTREMKTIILDGQEVTVPFVVCPPPMECADLLPNNKMKMSRRRG